MKTLLRTLATGTPKYILPPPLAVLQKIMSARGQLAEHALVTLTEVGLGLITGTALGILSALALQYSRLLRALLSPLLVSSQAIPVYALAPVLTLWFGFGILPKILMTVLIIYFPITTAAYDGLRRTPQGYLDLARSMNSLPRNTLLRLPAVLPALRIRTARCGRHRADWRGHRRMGRRQQRPGLPHDLRQRTHPDRPTLRRPRRACPHHPDALQHHRPPVEPPYSLEGGGMRRFRMWLPWLAV